MAPPPDPPPASTTTVLAGELRRLAQEGLAAARRLTATGRARPIDAGWILDQLQPPPPRPPPPPPPPSDQLEGVVVEACNTLFRIGADHARLRSDDPELDAAIRRIGTNLRQFTRELRRRRIESLDLAGRPFDPNLNEFEPRGHVAVSGVSVPTIHECFRPLVTRDGRIVQPAVGVVANPQD